jgi:hypothetical protein
LFPRRAGTYGAHPQGYSADFYSFAHLKQAVTELSDYTVRIRKKPGVWGNWVTVTRKSTGATSVYEAVDAAWLATLHPPHDEETAMLDEAFDVRPNSRLSCQILYGPDLDGLTVTLAPEVG